MIKKEQYKPICSVVDDKNGDIGLINIVCSSAHPPIQLLAYKDNDYLYLRAQTISCKKQRYIDHVLTKATIDYYKFDLLPQILKQMINELT